MASRNGVQIHKIVIKTKTSKTLQKAYSHVWDYVHQDSQKLYDPKRAW